MTAAELDFEIRRALCLNMADAIRNSNPPGELAAFLLILVRLISPELISASEEKELIQSLYDGGWELTAPFDPERWKELLDG